MTNVLILRPENQPDAEKPVLQNVPALLRKIADELESGDYGLAEAKVPTWD